MTTRRPITFLAEYFGAIRARRRIAALGEQSDEEALEFARTFRWRGGRIAPTQTPEEILWLLDRVRECKPRVIVEIGTDEGGTLFLWSRVAPDDAVIVAIDSRPLGMLGRVSAYAIVRRGFARGQQRLELLFGRDSHDSMTVEDLERTLADTPIDFLFIDGDHSYEGVRQDFERYASLVRPGGMVALHDVVAADAPGVARFWSELAETHATEVRADSIYGIGIVHVASAGVSIASG